ncbi:MAG: V-type ATPase subunit [Firmicutes bacterium]|nr:V-type ATPase subunit [Bacillota bacterium]
MEQYTYAAAYVRALENNMFTNEQLADAAREKNTEDIAQLMREKGYSGGDIFEMLDNEMNKTWDICFELCPGEKGLRTLLLENDFHNVKAVLKATAAAVDWHELTKKPYLTEPQAIADAFKNGDYSELSDELAEVCRKAYAELAKNGDAQYAEIFLDRRLYEMMKKRSNENTFLHGYTERLILAADLKIYLRAEGKPTEFLEAALIESELIDVPMLAASDAPREKVLKKQGYSGAYEAFKKSPGTFDKWCDDEINGYMKSAEFSFFGFDTVAAYIIAKKTEIKNLRTIIYGRLSAMPTEEITERLRETYV